MEGHLYERDLNLLGEASLFGLLDTVRTGIGQRGAGGVSAAWCGGMRESVARQAAVRELAGADGAAGRDWGAWAEQVSASAGTVF